MKREVEQRVFSNQKGIRAIQSPTSRNMSNGPTSEESLIRSRRRRPTTRLHLHRVPLFANSLLFVDPPTWTPRTSLFVSLESAHSTHCLVLRTRPLPMVQRRQPHATVSFLFNECSIDTSHSGLSETLHRFHTLCLFIRRVVQSTVPILRHAASPILLFVAPPRPFDVFYIMRQSWFSTLG